MEEEEEVQEIRELCNKCKHNLANEYYHICPFDEKDKTYLCNCCESCISECERDN